MLGVVKEPGGETSRRRTTAGGSSESLPQTRRATGPGLMTRRPRSASGPWRRRGGSVRRSGSPAVRRATGAGPPRAAACAGPCGPRATGRPRCRSPTAARQGRSRSRRVTRSCAEPASVRDPPRRTTYTAPSATAGTTTVGLSIQRETSNDGSDGAITAAPPRAPTGAWRARPGTRRSGARARARTWRSRSTGGTGPGQAEQCAPTDSPSRIAARLICGTCSGSSRVPAGLGGSPRGAQPDDHTEP